MWRSLATMLLLAGCNALFGIHDISDAPDGGGDPCTGVCECKTDQDCAASHTTCIDRTTSRTCECIAGYAMAAGGCAWSGVVDDPGFAQASDRWSLAGAATRDPTAAPAAGMQDPGRVVLTGDASSANAGQVTQMITMPRRSRAEPLVLSATFTTMCTSTCPNNLPICPVPTLGPLLGVGTGWYASPQMPVTTSFVTTRVCLGAAHYAPESTSGPGAPLPLSMLLADVLGGALAACDPGASQLILDHVDIVPATAADGCPDPGQVPNGDAEGSGGWTFSTSGSFGMAAIVAGIGAGGSHGVQLQVGRGCASATATLSVSVPLASAQGSPALTLYHDGAVGGFTVGLGDLELPLSGGAQRTDRYCVPSTMRGEVFPLTALLEGVSGDCTDLTSAQEVLDNVAIENDPACGIDPGIADPGFEATSKLLGADAIGTGTAKVVADAAHGGHVLQLTRGNTCDEASFEIDVATPAVRPGEGAGVAFSYSLSASANALTVSSSTQTFTAKRGGWTQGMVCLDPRHPGAPQRVFIDLSTASSSCNTIQPADTAEIDDLSAISTPACPAM